MRRVYRLYRQFYQQRKLLVIAYLALTVLHKAVSLLMPLAIQQLIDSAVSADAQRFLRFVWVNLGLTLLFIALLCSRYYVQAIVENDGTVSEKKQLLMDILRMPLHTLKQKPIGHYMQLVTRDVDKTSGLIVYDLPVYITNLLMTGVMIVYLLQSDWKLTLIIAVTIPLFILITKIMLPKVEDAGEAVVEQSEKVNTLVDECYGGAESIRAENADAFFQARIAGILAQLKQRILRSKQYDAAYDYLFVTGLLNLANILIYCFGGWRIIQGAITIGTVTTFSLYFSTLWNSVEGFMDFFKEYRVKMISVTRLLTLHQHAQQQNDSLANQKELPPFETLHMENLRFSYQASTVFEHFSLDVHQGEKLLLTGANGSGKSTLARILIKLVSPDAGSLRYNQIPYDDIDPAALRKRIVLASAEPFLIEGSLEENFFGHTLQPDAAPSFPADQPIAKDGENLSTGQKKTLQLMRCLSGEGDVYILDEPFAHVDPSAKEALQRMLEEKLSGKTLLLISHDTDLKMQFDRVVHLKRRAIHPA